MATTGSRLTGFHLGKVVDDVDPEQRGRLQIVVPTVTPGLQQWAMPCVPFAGADRGVHLLPRTGELVWVTFEAGEPSRPIWVGGLWASGDLAAADAAPATAVIRTPKAWITVDGVTGSVTIENDGGSTITMSSSEITISAGTVTIEASGRRIDLGASAVSVNQGALEVS